MKVEYINPFIIATRKVLSTMAFMESKPGRPSLKALNDFKALGDISAVIELSGESKGSIGVSFTKKCVLEVAKQMFGEEYSEINEDIEDMIGEIVNMVSGEARRELAKLGFHFSAGIPVSMKGENHELKHFVSARIILIPFMTNSGPYYIEACFDAKDFLG
ncbi:MAG: chemotaxis protein CheX [SAR324 cluster bacterium]|uniref:Chemotaxis protein CheX n=1 Tax=SAR324 cluster bacterium TaxID=2024889 RepID=A0A2A4TAG2_9DELT|nr:MAG: chemotaxis protein CheX [SAR324 cluster bacterium]